MAGEHRRSPRATIAAVVRTAEQALSLVRRRGAVPLAAAGGPQSLVEAVVGGPVKGSWWGHPQGGLIYALAGALEDSPDVLVVKLAAGKVTFVHRRLWPALLRLASDAGHRRRALRHLGAEARRLLARVERVGELRLDELARTPQRRRALKAAAQELERRLLAFGTSVHTAQGRHATVLRSWRSWAAPGLLPEARRLSHGGARRLLERAAGPLVSAE